jgi:Uma2 family endonuclease
MSATEFLAWDDGTDTRYELIDGVPVAMAPGGVNHAQITGNVHRIIDDAVRDRRPCRAVPGGGLRLQEGPPGRVYIPDVLMTCEPIEAKQVYEAARLVVEVLSPSTGSYDKRFKLPRYAGLPSIEEIWLVDSRVRLVHAWQRINGRWQDGLPLIGRATFTSHVLGVEVSLDAVYDLTSLAVSPEEGAEEAGAEDADRDDGEQR